MRTPALSLKGRHNYADYLTWGEEERWEIMEGVAYNMRPGPTSRHQRLVREYWMVDPETERVMVHRLDDALTRYTVPQYMSALTPWLRPYYPN